VFGFSEGNVQKEIFRKELKEYYNKSQKSSMSRSRSKSKIARLREARQEAEAFKHEGIIGQM
jgi:hypothetical protein